MNGLEKGGHFIDPTQFTNYKRQFDTKRTELHCNIMSAGYFSHIHLDTCISQKILLYV